MDDAKLLIALKKAEGDKKEKDDPWLSAASIGEILDTEITQSTFAETYFASRDYFNPSLLARQNMCLHFLSVVTAIHLFQFYTQKKNWK